MKKGIFLRVATYATAVLFTLYGCSHGPAPVTPPVVVTTSVDTGTDTSTTPAPTPTLDPAILKTIENAGGDCVDLAFKAWALENQAAAKEAATALGKSTTDFIAYLDGGKLGVSSEVMTLLNSSLLNDKIPAQYGLIISGAIFVLQEFLPVPSTTTYMTPTQIAYTRSFCVAIQNGVTTYLMAPNVPVNARNIPAFEKLKTKILSKNAPAGSH